MIPSTTTTVDSSVAHRPSVWQRLERWRNQRRTHALVHRLLNPTAKQHLHAGTSTDHVADDEAIARSVQRLLQAGADPNGRMRVTHGNLWHENPALMLALIRSWAMDDAWSGARANGGTDGAALRTVRALLDAGADPNDVRTQSPPRTPAPQDRNAMPDDEPAGHYLVLGSTSGHQLPAGLLHVAVDLDLDEVVVALLQAGARPEPMDGGVTVWERVRSVATAQALLDAGGDPFQLNTNGMSRLDQERQDGHPFAELSAWLEQQALRRVMAETTHGTVVLARGRSRL